MKKDDTTRQKLAKVFEDFEAEPQPETWEHIRAAIQKKKKKRPILWLFFGIGLALLITIGFYIRTSAKQSPLHTSTNKTLPTNSGASGATERAIPQNVPPHVSPKVAGDNGVYHNQPTSVATNGKAAFEQQENLGQSTNNNQPTDVVTYGKAPFEQQENLSQSTNNNQPTDVVTYGKAAFEQQENLGQSTNNNQPTDVVTYGKAAFEQQENLGQSTNENGADRLVLSSDFSTKKVDTPAVSVLEKPLDPLDDLKKSKRQKGREGGWTVSFTTLFSYQLTQSRVHEGKIATNISNLPSFDAQRLGTSLAIGYQIPLKKRSDCSIALAWTNLPYRAQYDRASANQVQINFQSNNQYTTKRITESAVNDAYRLNLWGLQLNYGYTFNVLDKKIRVFAGGEGLLYDRNPELWGSAGLDIPLGKSKFQLMPVFKYQFKAMEQPDLLLKTKLYTVGLGIKRII
jgi:hypothetical protein